MVWQPIVEPSSSGLGAPLPEASLLPGSSRSQQLCSPRHCRPEATPGVVGFPPQPQPRVGTARMAKQQVDRPPPGGSRFGVRPRPALCGFSVESTLVPQHGRCQPVLWVGSMFNFRKSQSQGCPWEFPASSPVLAFISCTGRGPAARPFCHRGCGCRKAPSRAKCHRVTLLTPFRVSSPMPRTLPRLLLAVFGFLSVFEQLLFNILSRLRNFICGRVRTTTSICCNICFPVMLNQLPLK